MYFLSSCLAACPVQYALFFIVTRQAPLVMMAPIFSVRIFRYVHKVAKKKTIIKILCKWDIYVPLITKELTL